MACPAFVEGQSYRPITSGNRYVYQGGMLHHIPDEATAAAHGWTDWTDVDPLCIVGHVGDPIASSGAVGARVGIGAGPVPAAPSSLLRNPLVVGAAAVGGLLLLTGHHRRRRH